MPLHVTNRPQLLGPNAALTASERALRVRAIDAYEVALVSVEATAATARVLRQLGPLPGRVVVFAFGKAARAMAAAALDVLPVHGGFLIDRVGDDLGPISGRVGEHPTPSKNAASVGAEVLQLACSLGPGDTALCLVSGGGSSMLELPIPTMTMEEIVERTKSLLRGGLDIGAINQARSKWSQLKGGGLARALSPARVVNLVVSDVAPLGLDCVASGPTIALNSEEHLVSDGFIAAQSAAHALAVCVQVEPLRGEARTLGQLLVSSGPRVYYGEPHVTVTGTGDGGRCRELALAALNDVQGVLLAAGTDGRDGHDSGAGAIVDPGVRRRARALGLDPGTYLANNDSATFFQAVGSTIQTGPTGTNVADLVLVL
jgi:glycerate 2-kinase